MQAKILALLLVVFFSFSNLLNSQTTYQDKFYYANVQGEKITVSKIISSKTNENQLTFTNKGVQTTLQAKDVRSYYAKGEKLSVKIANTGEYKLVKIVVAGPIFLGSSVKENGKDGYYLKKDDKWYDLEPHRKNLKKHISTLVADFDKAVSKKRIPYDLHALGTAISSYNAYKDPIYTKRSKFEIRHDKRFGLTASTGLSLLTFQNGLPTETSSSLYSIGLASNIEYNRVFGFNMQLVYTNALWNTSPDYTFELNTLQFSPMVQTLLFSNYKNFDAKLGAGLNFNVDLNSEIDFPTLSLNPVSLKLFSVGYHIQLTTTYNKIWNLFLAYQLNPNLITQNIGIADDSFLTFNIQSYKVGAMFLF